MADEVIKACIDRLLPDHLRILAAQNAVKENPAPGIYSRTEYRRNSRLHQ